MNLNKAYDIFGISKDASSTEITNRYKTLALKYHPDRGGSTEEMSQINNAYDVIIKSHKNSFEWDLKVNLINILDKYTILLKEKILELFKNPEFEGFTISSICDLDIKGYKQCLNELENKGFIFPDPKYQGCYFINLKAKEKVL